MGDLVRSTPRLRGPRKRNRWSAPGQRVHEQWPALDSPEGPALPLRPRLQAEEAEVAADLVTRIISLLKCCSPE